MSLIVVNRRVDWQDTDAAGHYHHGTVIRWIEAAEAELMQSLGLSWLFGRIPRVRYSVDYLDRMWFGDTASTILSIRRVGRSSMTYGFVITRIPEPRSDTQRGTPTVAVRGEMTVVHAPIEIDDSAPWPPHVATLLGQVAAAAVSE